MKNLEFDLPDFGFTLVLYFLTVFPILPFDMVVYMLEVCICFFYFDFSRIIVKGLPSVSEETLDFGLLNKQCCDCKDLGDF